jgi:BlaI family transcriptional regulator, penicillinase repressor
MGLLETIECAKKLALPEEVPMRRDDSAHLSRRERQIMDALFARGQATVAEILAALPDPPTDTAVRTLMRILEEKGHVRRGRLGKRNVYRPSVPRDRAARSALKRVLDVFFGGSLGDAVAAELSDPSTPLDPDELSRLARLIARARSKER